MLGTLAIEDSPLLREALSLEGLGCLGRVACLELHSKAAVVLDQQ